MLSMYESSCSYQSALDLKRVASAAAAAQLNIKTEAECGSMGGGVASAPGGADWASGCAAYRFGLPGTTSTFEQLKQSVEKAKAALQSPVGAAIGAAVVPPVNGAAANYLFGDLAAPLSSFARDGHARLHDDEHKRTHSGLHDSPGSRDSKSSSHAHTATSSTSSSGISNSTKGTSYQHSNSDSLRASSKTEKHAYWWLSAKSSGGKIWWNDGTELLRNSSLLEDKPNFNAGCVYFYTPRGINKLNIEPCNYTMNFICQQKLNN